MKIVLKREEYDDLARLAIANKFLHFFGDAKLNIEGGSNSYGDIEISIMQDDDEENKL